MAYINKVLYQDKKYFGLGESVLKTVDGSSASLASLNKPSALRWLAEKAGGKYTPLQGTLLDFLKAGTITREANNQIRHPAVKTAVLQFFRDSVVKDNDAALKAALDKTIADAGTEAHVDVAAFKTNLAQTIAEARDALNARKTVYAQTKPGSGGTVTGDYIKEGEEIAAEEDRINRAAATLARIDTSTKAATTVANAAKSGVGTVDAATDAIKLAAKSGPLAKFAGAGKLAGKLVGGPWELLLNVIIGAGTTELNRYLASRQALKLFPLQSCHKEFTAGINGHLGSVAGDPLGPSKRVIEYLLGSGAGSLQHDASQTVLGTLFGAQLGESLGVNIGGSLIGINDPHYNTTDGAYHELMAAYGFQISK